MRTRTTWLLALATLVAAIVFLREQTDAPEGTRQARLLDSPADITSIQIERPEESLRLVREGSAWLITEPVRAQAEAARVEILLNTLANPGELRAIEPTDAGPGLMTSESSWMMTLLPQSATLVRQYCMFCVNASGRSGSSSSER